MSPSGTSVCCLNLVLYILALEYDVVAEDVVALAVLLVVLDAPRVPVRMLSRQLCNADSRQWWGNLPCRHTATEAGTARDPKRSARHPCT